MSEFTKALESISEAFQEQRIPTNGRIAFIPRRLALDAIAEAAASGEEMSLQPCQEDGREGYDVLIGHQNAGITVYVPSEDDL